MINKRLLGFDFGLKRIGVASGQLITKTATPLSTVQCPDQVPNWHEISKLIHQWRPTDIIVGLPIDTYGEETEITKLARLFSEELAQRFNKPVHLVEEAYSTREARWKLEEVKGKKINHLKVDALAACVILETWMTNFS
ncbi:Holliday junction resolvase RuvX [Thiotrichales bacterium 19S3-7]|nr:Holliday junction resolvase RuvX [Thiotrichales bacterium 19S3-7]MCF6801569.1 Holliday junction resolvase RuvX [Thiotrichales bacterium 19S3-11]